MVVATSEVSRNQILARLPDAELDRISDLLELVDTPLRLSLYEPGEPIEHVLFPVDAVFSLVAGDGQGSQVEVSTIGREGMVGLPGSPALDCRPTTPSARSQAGCSGHRPRRWSSSSPLPTAPCTSGSTVTPRP